MKKRTSADNTPPEDEAFVQVDEPVGDPQSATMRRVRLPITSDGVDWSSIPDDQKPLIIAALANDAEILTQIAGTPDEEGGEAGEPEGPKKYLRDEHANTFLNILAAVERKFLPLAIRQILKRPMAPEVIQEAFQFSAEQRQSVNPALLEMGEELIPEKYKIIIAYGSDKYKAIGLIAWAIKEQVENAVKMQLDYEKIHPPQTGPNGTERKPEEGGKVQ